MQIADIAWTRLSPKAKAEITEMLLAGDTDFRPASHDESDVRTAFDKAATWPDWIKGNSQGLFEDMIRSWNDRFQPGLTESERTGEAVRCKRWHYFDEPLRYKGSKPGVEPSNALVAMTTARLELTLLEVEKSTDRKSECWWLYWLEHVVGDLHQPLHCVSSFEFEPQGDAGGNLFKLGLGYPDNPEKKMNLHSLWDAGIENAISAEKGMPDDPASVTSRWIKEAAPSESDAQDLDFADWITTGAVNAEKNVYAGVERGDKPDAGYMSRQAQLCKRLAVLAGYRLAEVLNKAIGD